MATRSGVAGVDKNNKKKREDEEFSRSKRSRISSGAAVARGNAQGEGGVEATSSCRADQDRILLERRKVSNTLFSTEVLVPFQLSNVTAEESRLLQLLQRKHGAFLLWRQRQGAQHFFYLNRDFHIWGEAAFGKFADAVQEKGDLKSAGAPVPQGLLDRTEGSYARTGREYCRRARAIAHWFTPSLGDTFTFGFGDSGQLGCGDAIMEASRPRRVEYLRSQNVVAVTGGGLHSMALTLEGDVYAWGPNDDGAVGNYYDDYAYAPRIVEGFRPFGSSSLNSLVHDEEIMSIASGDAHNLCLSRSGNVYFFGVYKDKDGQRFRDVPPPGDGRELRLEKMLSKQEEDLDNPVRYEQAPKFMQKWPAHLHRIPARKVLAVDCGFSFNVALVLDPVANAEDDNTFSPDMAADTMLTWGIDICGELGRGTLPPMRREDKTYDLDAVRNLYLKPSPVQWAPEPGATITVKKKILAVAAGGNHFLALASGNGSERDLSVYSTGLNNGGQLGHGDTKNRNILTRIVALDGCHIQQLAAGAYHSLCLDSTGRKLYAFGRGDSGQLGTNASCDQWYHESTPVTVSLDFAEEAQTSDVEGGREKNPSNPYVVQIACGHNHSLLRTNTGSLYTWGYGDLDALGHGTGKDVTIPTKVQFGSSSKPKKNVFVRHVAGGGQHSIIVASVSRTA